MTKLLDPTSVLKLSMNCCPDSCCDPIWDEDQMIMLEPISDFLKDSFKSESIKVADDTLKAKTGHDLIEITIQNDYFEIMNLIFYRLHPSSKNPQRQTNPPRRLIGSQGLIVQQ